MERPINEIALGMNVAFNEISISPLANSSHELKRHFLGLAKTVKKLKDNYGISHIVFPSNLAEIEVLPNKMIHEWLSELHGLEKQQIVSLISRKPFSNEVIEEHEEEIDSYVVSNEELQIEETICIGLGITDICQTASASLNTHDFWKSEEIPFSKLDYATEERSPLIAPNCCQDELSETLIAWFEKNTEVELDTTDENPATKHIHFRDDHGTDVLMAFAKRIVNSEYVVSVINSIKFNPKTSRFIRKYDSDGKIEIILHWEDAGYGMVVQSTGRNYRETESIAQILKEKYDR